MNSDLYAVLGAQKGDTAPALSAAYRRRAKQTHPDHGGNPDEFRDVTFAWNILKDPEKRKRYDETGKYDFQFPRVTQRALIKMLSDEIEVILTQLDKERMPIEALNITETLRNKAKEVVGVLKERCEAAQKRVHQLDHLLRSVSRKDEEENLFVEMLAPKVADANDKVKDYTAALYIARRYLEELEMYDSPVDMMRAMQASMYAVYGETQKNYTVSAYAPATSFGFDFGSLKR